MIAVLVHAVLAGVLHAQMHRRQLEGLGQGQDVGVLAHKLLLRVRQRLLEGCPGLEAHAAGDARLLGAHDVDGAGVHLGDVAAAHHREAVEGMERVSEPVLADVLLVGGIVLAQTVHVRQSVHVVVLEVGPLRTQVGPQLVVEEAVTDGRADDDAVVAHHALEAQHLGAQRLHYHDGVGAHAVAVVELLGHAEHQHVVLLLRPVHVGALVGDLPALGHHLGGVARVDGDLAALGVQHRVAAKEGMAHLLLHQHADFVELVAHEAAAVHGGEVVPVHDLGHMVAGNAAPVGDAGGAVLIAARVAAVGVALYMADEDGQVALEHVLVHPHRVAPLGGAQVDHVVRVLGVVAGHLVGGPELVEQLLTEDGLVVLELRTGVQAVGDDELDVLLLHARGIQLLQDELNAHLAVAGGLLAALDAVGHNEDHLRAGEG